MDSAVVNKRIEEKFVLLLACLIIGFDSIQGALLTALREVVVLPGKLDTAFSYVFYAMVVLLALRSIFERIKWDSLAMILFFLISFLLSVSLYGGIISGWPGIAGTILLSVCCYIVARSITDTENFKKYLNITGILTGVSIFLLLFVFRTVADEDYTQYFGYIALIAAVISVSSLFEKPNLIHAGNLVLSLLVLIFSGARGPLVCFGAFVVIKMFFISGISGKKRLAIMSVTALILLLFLLFFQDIMIYLYDMGSGRGFSLRLITRLTEESMFEDPARISLVDASLKLIKENPVTGVGVYHDRVLLNNITGESLNEISGSYPHNIFLEIFLQYGLIIGSLMTGLFLFFLYKAIFRNKDKELRDIILILFSCAFLPLLLSKSYLQSGIFFLFLGFCVNAVSNEKTTD